MPLSLVPEWLVAVAAAGLGLLVGSFLNVVAARVPAGASVVTPRSACPRCGSPIRSRDNVPVLSWLLLRGRCRDCAEPISVRYPLVEAGTAALFGLAGLRFGADPVLLPYLLFAGVSVALAVIDLDTHRLPDAIVLPAYPAVLVLAAAMVPWHGVDELARAAAGGALLWAAYFALWFGTGGRGMGYGDVKLAGLVGGCMAWLGWGHLVAGGFGAFVIGGCVGVALMVLGRARRRTAIPFGPFMLAGAWLAILAGDGIVRAYLRVVGLDGA